MKQLTLLLLLYLPAWLAAQNVGIGTATPDPTAKLEVQSTNAGFLPPRLTTAQRDAIVTPAEGLAIYNTDTKCMEFWNGTEWISTCATLIPCSKPPVGAASSNTPVCSGQTLNLSTTPVAGATYVWNGPNGFTSTAQNPSISSVTTAADGTYRLRTWLLGCYSDEVTTNVTILPSGWQRMNNFTGTARYAGIGFAIGSKGYFGTGTTNLGCTFINDWWEYDPVADTWTGKLAPPVGTAMGYAGCFAVADSGYMVGGYYCSVYHKTLYRYDPATNTWASRATFPGVGRAESFLNVASSTLGYFGNGDAGGCGVNDWYSYNPTTNAWTARTTWPGIRREGHVGMTIGTKMYVGLGHEYACAPTGEYADWYEYDPGTNAWTAKANGPAGQHGAYFALGSYGYVITNANDMYRYDPVANTWTQLPCDYPGAAPGDWETVTMVFGGSAYIINGRTREVWRYTP